MQTERRVYVLRAIFACSNLIMYVGIEGATEKHKMNRAKQRLDVKSVQNVR